MYQTFYQQNQNLIGELFQGPVIQSADVQTRLEWGGQLTAGELIRDRRAQLRRFTNIEHMANRLRRRGLPESLLQQILKLPPDEAQKQLRLIGTMTNAQIREYTRLWNRGQKLAHDATMRDLRAQLKDWRKHGRQIALAIAAGLRDENTALTASLRSLIYQMFPSLRPRHGGDAQPERSRPGRTRSTGEPDKTPAKHEHHTHYHVTAPKSQHPTVKQQLAEANWHHRTRY